jgi:DNA-binding beta-propeller fold protein YncE
MIRVTVLSERWSIFLVYAETMCVNQQAVTFLLLLSPILAYAQCDTLFFADTGNWQIRAISLSAKSTTTLTSLDIEKASPSFIGRFYRQSGMAVSLDGNYLYVTDGIMSAVRFVNISGRDMSTLSHIELATGLALSADGIFLYVTSTNASKGIYQITLSTAVVSTLAGGTSSGFQDGPGPSAKFTNPFAITIAHNGKALYIADENAIRILNLDTTEVSTLLRNYSRNADGSNGIRFNSIVASGDGEWLYATALQSVLRVSTATGEVMVLTSSLASPLGIAISPNGGILYVSDAVNNQIVMIDPATGNLSVLSGMNQPGYIDGLANETRMYWPYALALSPPCAKPPRPASKPLLRPPNAMGQGPCEQPNLSWQVCSF